MTRFGATSLEILAQPRAIRRVEPCMGTVFSIDVRFPGCAPGAVDDVIEWLHRVDATFSTYRSDSEISRLGRGELREGDCTSEVRKVLDRCRRLEFETDGYFSLHSGGTLDPSGLVKGWAIQRASEMLAAAGSRNHCVNGGGDVRCEGSGSAGEPWRIGVADPLRAGALVAVVTGCGLAVATSGSAERGSHILDPHDGSSPTALASVTVVGRELATADAYATAAFAMGADAPSWLESLDDHRALVVYGDGTQWANL